MRQVSIPVGFCASVSYSSVIPDFPDVLMIVISGFESRSDGFILGLFGLIVSTSKTSKVSIVVVCWVVNTSVL